MNLSIFTGLGDPRWFTGGYAFPPPALILQGWGVPPRLVLQGFGPGGPPAGPAAGGGLAHGGAAAVSSSAATILVGAGGITHGGSGAVRLDRSCGAVGGTSRGGSLAPLVHRAGPARGGMAHGGGASPAALHMTAAAGGMATRAAASYGRSVAPAAGGGAAAMGGHTGATTHLVAAASGGLRLGGTEVVESIVYAVYMNTGVGDPVDYGSPLAVTEGTRWTSHALAVPGHYRFAVRARSTGGGLEEHNLDAAVELLLDETGRDVTALPPAPLGARAFPLAGGRIRVEWSCPCADPSRQPEGFRVYAATSPSPQAAAPAAVVPWRGAQAGAFSATLEGLSDGTMYYILIRAYNASGEESNSRAIAVEADGAPPGPVDGLSAAATCREG